MGSVASAVQSQETGFARLQPSVLKRSGGSVVVFGWRLTERIQEIASPLLPGTAILPNARHEIGTAGMATGDGRHRDQHTGSKHDS
jgi:hypothetical protein